MKRRNWQQEEDNALLQNCQLLNYNWKRVSKNMNLLGYKRSGKSCKERFQNQLNPQINKDQWTQNEIEKLFELQIKYGNKWKIIAKELPNRTDGLIKNHFYSLVRKVLRRLLKSINKNKKGSQMTNTLKPSVISSIFCANQNESDNQKINIEFAELFRKIIMKYKNYNFSQQIDYDDVAKIKFIFLTLQKLNESYNCDTILNCYEFTLIAYNFKDKKIHNFLIINLTIKQLNALHCIIKKTDKKVDQKQEKQIRKQVFGSINEIIVNKINKKLPIFTIQLYPIEKFFKRQANLIDHHSNTQLQLTSSLPTQNIEQVISFSNQQQFIFCNPLHQYYYSMSLNAYLYSQHILSNQFDSYRNGPINFQEEKQDGFSQ